MKANSKRIPRSIDGQRVAGALRRNVELAIEQGVWDADDWRTSFDLLAERVAAADRLVCRYKEIEKDAIGEIVSEQLARARGT